MKSVSFCTLGCKVNQYETEAMLKLFSDAGYEIKNFDEVCDVYVINTCTVTGMGDRKSRQMIHRAKKLNPKAVIVAAGCYSQVAPDEIKKIDGVSLIIGTSERAKIVGHVEEYLKEREKNVFVSDIMKQREYEDLWVSSYSSKTRAFVKIEDGCTEFCTYCIIPYARGPVRSRPLASIEKEVKQLAQNGFKEIVLTGIHIASYGKDTKKESLLDVIRLVSSVDGIERVRLGSVEPRILTENFIKEIAGIKKVCNHFHISLQSGCTETLKRMNRKYTAEEYENSVNILRKYFDNPAIATDIMVGFPGETEEEFNKSLNFAKKTHFADAHVFAYSNRKGTKADTFPNQVDKKVKEERSKILTSCIKKMHSEYLKKLIGETTEVLFEKRQQNGAFEGHMTNYTKVHVNTGEDISNKILKVKITDTDGSIALGEIVG